MAITALCLSGGGSKGAFQEGALSVLRDYGFEYDIVAGVSVGALNGVMVACGELDLLKRIWDTIEEKDIYGPERLGRFLLRLARWKIGFGDPPLGWRSNKPLRKLLEHYLADKHLQVPFYAGRVSLESGRFVDDVESEYIVEGVLASTAIPVYVPPVKIQGELFVDGGVRTISPLSRVLKHDPDEVVIINTDILGEPHTASVPTDIIRIAERAIGIATNETFNEDLRRYLELNRHAKEAAEQGATLTQADGRPTKYFETILIEPPYTLGSGTNFNRKTLEEWRELGRQAARLALN